MVVASRRKPSADLPGPLTPNGSALLIIVGMLAGSVAFGWMHQALWLMVPPIAFIGDTLWEVGRHSARAKREMNLTPDLPFRGYGKFAFLNPVIDFVLFGVTWAATSLP
jgi:hypothetical protein